MLFDSYVFLLCFLPITIFGFILLKRFNQHYLRLAWLVFASLFFYGWWNPSYLILLLSSIALNYIIGKKLWKRFQQNKNIKVLLFFGVSLNLLFIGYFKYANFLISNLNGWVGTHFAIEEILLPLAISFFTFQMIAFLVDVSKGKIDKLKFAEFSLFVCFFPQLIAGPIVQYQQIVPQFLSKKGLRISSQTLSIGFTIFIIGLLKKVAFADSIAVYANAVFDAAGSGVDVTFWEAWCGSFSYGLQLYFDFSGYSDMALGLGYLFGVKLPVNFNSPYKASNIIDFWRRWHMTLSGFLKEYLYIPLGGSRCQPWRRHANLMITMLLGGLWHGANWTFVMWGGLHGSFLIINHGWRKLLEAFQLEFNSAVYRILCQSVTLFAVITAWVPFRAENFTTAKAMLQTMYSYKAISLPVSLTSKFMFLSTFIDTTLGTPRGIFSNGLAQWKIGISWILVLLFVALCMPNTLQLVRYHMAPIQVSSQTIGSKAQIAWQPNTLWASLFALSALIALMLLSNHSEFIYFQF